MFLLWLLRVGSNIEIGSAAEWVTGLLTAGVLVLALSELRQDRLRWQWERDRERTRQLQSRLVAASLVGIDLGSSSRSRDQLGEEFFDIRIDGVVRNGSGGPIFDVTEGVSFALPVSASQVKWAEGTKHRVRHQSRLLRPEHDAKFVQQRFFGSSAPILEDHWIEWSDEVGFRWRSGGGDHNYPELVEPSNDSE